MKQLKNTESDLGDTSTPEKQPEENIEDEAKAVKIKDKIGKNSETKLAGVKEVWMVDVMKEIEELRMNSVGWRNEKCKEEEFTTGLNRDENQAGTSGSRHRNDNDDVDYAGHCNDEDDVGHVNDEDVHASGNDEVDFAEENEATEKSAKEAAEKTAKEATEKAEKEAAEKKNKQAAEKEKKEKAKKEAAEKKKAEMRKAAAEKKQQAEMQAAADAKLKDKMQKDAEEKKQSPSKRREKINLNRLLKKVKKKAETFYLLCNHILSNLKNVIDVDVSEATTVPKTFESPKVQQKKKQAAEKSAKEDAEKTTKETKEKAEKEAAEKAEREKIEAAEKEKKKKAEKEAAEKKKAEMEKAAAEKEQAEMQAAAEAKLKDKMQKDAEEKKQSPSKKKEKNKSEPTAEKGVDVSEATTVPKTFESPKVQQKMFGKGQESTEKPKGKRITKPSVYLKSPFMNKMVKTQDKLDEDEILCARSVFCMQGDISEVVFDDGKVAIAHRKEMQSLAPGIEIEKQIIDTFVTVLNYEERIRTDGKDLRRRYFPTDAVLLNEDKDQAKQYESFENVIKNQMNASESKKKMKDVELAFFPKVVAAGQYYVIVFNLLKANAVILDNEKHDDYNKYKEVFDSVKVLFLEYLQKHQHPCVEKLSKDKPAKVLKMKWKTEKTLLQCLYMFDCTWILSSKQSRKRSKAKKKREEKKSPGRWTRSDETKLLAEKHKRIKKQQANNQQTRKNEDKGKEEVVDVEQESEMNERLEKQKQAETEKKIKNKGKEKVVDVEDESETNERVQKQSFNRVLKGRATVRPLFEAMRGLTPQRKRVVREMGFGNLIDFPIVEIPTKLAFYVVDILNTRKMMLECPMGDIVITPKTVKEVLGLPMGRRKLEREGQREYNDPFLEEWKDQFKNINKLTIKALSDLIIDTKNTDYMFRMNILTLIANTLGSCDNSSCLKFTVLRKSVEGE
ncbi:hypothetical protein Tco_0217348 [Tanacetum coccineum]